MHTYRYSQILSIAFPILLSTLMEQLIGMTDAAFLGRVGEVELGASALGGIYYVALFMLGLGFSIGAQILMARRNGQGLYAEIGNIFYHSLFFLLALGAVILGLSHFFSPLVLRNIIQSDAVYEATESYLVWRIPGIFFALANVLFRAFFIATTRTRTLTLNSIALVVSNILFNYTLIFGHFGLPALGIAGAALGSTLAEGVSLLFFIGYSRRRVPLAHYALDRLPKFRPGVLRKVLVVGIPVMFQNFLSLATWFLFFISVEHLGERYLAATNIVRNISAFTFMTVVALSSTASTLVSNLMGAGETESVWPLLRRVIALGFYLLTPVLVLIALFPLSVMHIFTDDYSLMETARTALYVLLSSYVFTIPTQILLHAVSATGNTRTGFFFECIALAVYTAYIAVAIFGMRVSLAWCWASEYVYSVVIFVLCMVYLNGQSWRNKVI